MPDKHPNTHRWGGPGASRENRDEPEPTHKDPRGPGTPTNPPQSQVGTGGGERDIRHSHDPREK